MDERYEIRQLHWEVVETSKDRIVLECRVSGLPDATWINFLNASITSKVGSTEYVVRRFGGNLGVEVADEADIANVVQLINESIPLANEQFDTQILAKRRQADADKEAEAEANRRRMQSAREILSKLQ